MQIQNLVEVDACLFDSGMIAQELIGADRFGNQTAVVDAVKA